MRQGGSHTSLRGEAEGDRGAEVDGGGDGGGSVNHRVFAGEDDLPGSPRCHLH